jgi:Mg2+ and Co2+ transporter CorA
MSQMTDEEVKQAIERHGLTVVPRVKQWNIRKIDEHGRWIAYETRRTLTEAVAEVVRQIEAQQKENANG